jgi:DNA-binding GntR family transcriptional regulator
MTVVRDLRIERLTTVDRVVEALRDEILTGQISPGTPLREQDLATAMGVSRGSVREAYSVLLNEGLLQRSSYRSVMVTQLGAADIRDLFQARRLIELAAVVAAGSASPAQLATLREAVEAFETATRSGASPASHEADVRIHSGLVGLLNSPRLSRIHAGLMAELRLALTTQYDADDPEDLIQRHRDFVELLSNGEVDAARSQLADRLAAAEDRLLGSAPAT